MSLPRRAATVLLAACSLHGHRPASAQDVSPPRSYRTLAEVTVLPALSDAVVWPPSLRVTLQRRSTLSASFSGSGLLLSDRFSRSAGATAGALLTVPLGPVLLEPFVEAGPGWTDARVTGGGSYTAVDSAGNTVFIERLRAVRGLVGLTGVGLTAVIVRPSGRVFRLTLGQWSALRFEEVIDSRLRFGLSIGRGRPAPRWYALARDSDPPTVQILGSGPAARDSVVVAGVLRVVAADESGIATIRVNDRPVPFSAAEAGSASGLGGEGVQAMVDLWPPLGGQPLSVEVRDSAGQRWRMAGRAYAVPDRQPPRVAAVLPDEASTRAASPPSVAVVDDPAGIAGGRLGGCPLVLEQPGPELVRRFGLRSTARVLKGWGPAQDSMELEVLDRAGNRALSRVGRPRAAGSPEPLRFELLTAAVVYRGPAARSARVRGAVLDPGGVGVSAVRVNGLAAPLGVDGAPARVAFGGWLRVGEDEDSVIVEAVSRDGRVIRRAVELSPTAVPSRGAFQVLVVDARGAAGSTGATELAGLAGPDAVLVGPRVDRGDVESAVARFRAQVGPSDPALIYFMGQVEAEPDDVDVPALTVGAGRLPFDVLDRSVRGLDAGVLMVAGRFRSSATWRAPVLATPGAPTPPGCSDPGNPMGSVVDLGAVAPERILEGLAGAADQSGDGAVHVAELLGYLGVEPPPGLLPFDPFVVLSVPGAAR